MYLCTFFKQILYNFPRFFDSIYSVEFYSFILLYFRLLRKIWIHEFEFFFETKSVAHCIISLGGGKIRSDMVIASTYGRKCLVRCQK